MNDEDVVIISEKIVLQNMSMIVEKESMRTKQNYFIWRLMFSLLNEMPKRFRILKNEFNQIFEGISTSRSRKIECVHRVNDYMGLALSKLYIDKYFDQNSRKEVTYSIFKEDFNLDFSQWK